MFSPFLFKKERTVDWKDRKYWFTKIRGHGSVMKPYASYSLLTIWNTFPYMQKFHYQKCMKEIIQEVKQLLKGINHLQLSRFNWTYYIGTKGQPSPHSESFFTALTVRELAWLLGFTPFDMLLTSAITWLRHGVQTIWLCKHVAGTPIFCNTFIIQNHYKYCYQIW